MLGTFSDSGQRCFVDVFGFMHLCVLLPNYGWGRDLHLQIEFLWLKVGGFRWQGSGTMDLCSCFWEVWPAADNVDHSKDHVTLSSQILEESIGRSATPKNDSQSFGCISDIVDALLENETCSETGGTTKIVTPDSGQ